MWSLLSSFCLIFLRTNTSCSDSPLYGQSSGYLHTEIIRKSNKAHITQDKVWTRAPDDCSAHSVREDSMHSLSTCTAGYFNVQNNNTIIIDYGSYTSNFARWLVTATLRVLTLAPLAHITVPRQPCFAWYTYCPYSMGKPCGKCIQA